MPTRSGRHGTRPNRLLSYAGWPADGFASASVVVHPFYRFDRLCNPWPVYESNGVQPGFMMGRGSERNHLGKGNMSGFRVILIGLGLPLGCAFIGLCAGFAIGLEVMSAHMEGAPKDVGHGPAYVGAGLCMLVSLAGMGVGALLGGALAVRFLRGHSKPDPVTE